MRAVVEQLVEESRAWRLPKSRVGRPPTATISSTASSPARAATESGSTRADHGLECPARRVDEHHPVGDDREQEIEGGPGEQHGDALPDGALVECRWLLRGRDGPLALVEHLHVAAERDRRQPVLGVVRRRAAPRQQRPTEADREAQHLEAEQARHEEMAELVNGDEHADRHEESHRAVELCQTSDLPAMTAGPLAT